MQETDYTYAVARIRAKEKRLLSSSDLELLLNQKDIDSCIRILQEKGFGGSELNFTADKLLAAETDKLWSLMKELVKQDGALDFFLVQNDFHNLKVSVKSLLYNQKVDDLFIKNGTVNAQTIFSAVEKREYNKLPVFMQMPAKEATESLLKTMNGQICDVIIDTAALSYIYKLGQESSNEAIRNYTEILVASANIKVAARCAKTKKPISFIKRSLVNCNSLNIEKLATASGKGFEEVCSYLEQTQYKEAASSLSISISAFEKWCDDFQIKTLKPQKWEPFTIGPLVAYVLARQNEIKAVRMILSAKQNDLDIQMIKERLREMYV